MAEKLLNSVEVARRLGVSLRHFYRLEADLIANHGLGRMVIGRTKKYTESSLERLIDNAVKREAVIKAAREVNNGQKICRITKV
ncbi:MAG: hypothetical protein JW720_10255 [Sedimentisphaerales bacterium]|nr:hypothetical protein [Sedimentisphaerales bacterium]